MFVYIYIHMYIYTRHVYTYIYIYMYICVYVYSYAYIYIMYTYIPSPDLHPVKHCICTIYICIHSLETHPANSEAFLDHTSSEKMRGEVQRLQQESGYLQQVNTLQATKILQSQLATKCAIYTMCYIQWLST